MDKKSIIFVLSSLPCGGVESSFLSYLTLFSPDRHSVTVLLIHKRGEWIELLPKWIRVEEVRLLDEDRRDIELGASEMFRSAVRRKDWRRLFVMLWRLGRWRARRRGIGFTNSFIMDAIKVARSLYPADFSFSYDLVVSYGCYCHSPLVARALLSGLKSVVWFHSEDQFENEGRGYYNCLYRYFDYRFAASKALAEAHNRDYCCGHTKFDYFPHYINTERCKKLADAYQVSKPSADRLHLLTVGRLSQQKGVDIAIMSLKLLRKGGHDIVWHWVGGGTNVDETAYRQLAKEAGVSEFFIFEGRKDNPFPFYRACGIYVQPSRFEGYCLTLAEARVFAMPIVSTDFAGAREQLKPNETGIIVDCPDAELIAKAIESIIQHPALSKKFHDQLITESVDTEKTVKDKWHRLLK